MEKLKPKIKILYAEDSQDDLFLMKMNLKELEIVHELIWTDNLNEFEKHIKEDNPDLVISDFDLVTFDGLDTLRVLRSMDTETPFILVSGTIGEERAVKIMKNGANDYVLKDKMERLVPAIQRELKEFANRKAKKEADEKLKFQNKEIARQNRILKENLEKIQEINEELKVAKQKAEESDRLKSAFLANMSHEIRTPLNSIVGFTEIFDEPEIDLETRKYYGKIIKDSSAHLLAIVNDVLDISKIETGQMNVKIEQCDLRKILAELKNMFVIEVTDKDIELEMNFPADFACDMHTDVSKFKQIMTNLLSNAIKFTSKGKVEFGLKKKDKRHIFYVKDTGIGIPEEYLEKIFDRFTQVESSTIRNYGGTGLGLAISKRLVEILGGELWLESKVGVGSTFFFVLPMFSKDCK